MCFLDIQKEIELYLATSQLQDFGNQKTIHTKNE